MGFAVRKLISEPLKSFLLGTSGGLRWQAGGVQTSPYSAAASNSQVADTDSSRELRTIAVQITNAMHVYDGIIPGGLASLAGKTVLDIGPGRDLGIALGFAGFGAHVISLDKYPCNWSPDFHPRLYVLLADLLKEEFQEFNPEPCEEVARNGRHSAAGLQAIAAPLEGIPEIPNGSVDVSHSNATFEHLSCHAAAFMELGRVTKCGGIGFHQVDLRDHRNNFASPLEYLTLPDTNVVQELAEGEHFYYYGNTPRASEYKAWFEAAGFKVRTDITLFASDAELEKVRGRLNPRYQRFEERDLAVLSAQFHLTKVF